jgi:hypothetical protein
VTCLLFLIQSLIGALCELIVDWDQQGTSNLILVDELEGESMATWKKLIAPSGSPVGWIPRCQAFGPLSQGHGFNSLGLPGLGAFASWPAGCVPSGGLPVTCYEKKIHGKS